jgi:hypothetical protein
VAIDIALPLTVKPTTPFLGKKTLFPTITLVARCDDLSLTVVPENGSSLLLRCTSLD